DVVEYYSNFSNICFLGEVSDLLSYIRFSDFFISASLHEGMPNAVLESLSVGTPVLLSNIRPHIEVFETAKRNIGGIFENNNLEDLKSQIEVLLSLDRSQLSRECTRVVLDEFSALKMAKQYQRLFRISRDEL